MLPHPVRLLANRTWEGRLSELHRITVDTARCGGRPTVRELRIRVTDIREMLASGASREEILEDYL